MVEDHEALHACALDDIALRQLNEFNKVELLRWAEMVKTAKIEAD